MTDPRGYTYSDEWRRICEAKFWLGRVRDMRPRTFEDGRLMLDGLLAPIVKRRGQDAVDMLRSDIAAERARQKAVA